LAPSATPPAPTGVTAAGASAAITLSWSEGAPVQGFSIERSSDGTNFTQIGTAGPSAASYTDSALPEGTTYWYRVSAINGVGTSAASSVASATTAAAATATFVGTDASTQGSWIGKYGGDGMVLAGGAASLPSYAQVALSGQHTAVWSSATTDVRGLQQPLSSSRLAATWFSATSFAVDLNLTDGQAHQVSAYLLDWDGGGIRSEQVQVVDAVTGAVINSQVVSSFQGGTYLTWNLSGHVRLVFTNLSAGSNAVLSGLFFGPAS
jgi:hypothetical protein